MMRFESLTQFAWFSRQTLGAKWCADIMQRLMLMILIFAAAGPASASTFDGSITEVAIGPSSTQSGYVRVSVLVAAHGSSCGNTLAFAYEYSNTDIVGKTLTAAFMAAKESGQPMHINGTGTCDIYGVEYVSSAHLL